MQQVKRIVSLYGKPELLTLSQFKRRVLRSFDPEKGTSLSSYMSYWTRKFLGNDHAKIQPVPELSENDWLHVAERIQVHLNAAVEKSINQRAIQSGSIVWKSTPTFQGGKNWAINKTKQYWPKWDPRFLVDGTPNSRYKKK
jgi:hypothetical protein